MQHLSMAPPKSASVQPPMPSPSAEPERPIPDHVERGEHSYQSIRYLVSCHETARLPRWAAVPQISLVKALRQTGVTAMVEDYPIYIMNCSNEDGSCPYEPLEGQAPTSVQPSISGTNTVPWCRGKNPSSTYPISVTLTSSGGSSTSSSVSQDDSKVSLSSSTGSWINVTCTGSHFSSQNGDISITATASEQTLGALYHDRENPFRKLTAIPPPQTFCNTSPQTYSTELKYNLIDNLQRNHVDRHSSRRIVSGARASENQSNWCDDAVTPGGGFTDPLTDVLAPPPLNFNPAPSPAPTCTGQPLGTTRYRSIPQTMHVGDSGSGGVQVQSDTLGYYGDHGQHDSIQSPSQPPQ